MSTPKDENPSSSKDGPPEEERVGYRKPPKHTRFKKGQCGNAKGRPKGSVGLQQMIRNHLNARLVVTVAGRRRSLTKKEIIAMTIVANGLKSDPRAVATILEVEAFAEGRTEPPDPNSSLLDADLVAAVRRRAERSAKLAATPSATPADPVVPAHTTDPVDPRSKP